MQVLVWLDLIALPNPKSKPLWQQRAAAAFSNGCFVFFQLFDLLPHKQLKKSRIKPPRVVFSYPSCILFSVFWVGNNGCSSLLLFLYFFSVRLKVVPHFRGLKSCDLNEASSYMSTGCIFQAISLPASRCSGFLCNLRLFHYVPAWDAEQLVCSDLKRKLFIFAYFVMWRSLKRYRNY